jgi:oxygen-independent coproporphyrinogen-3 oxidase
MFGIYIHIPYCKRKCGYCSFYSVTDVSAAPLYISALKKEIVSGKPKTAGACIADTVYIGGGTPSVLPLGSLSEILKAVKKRFYITDDAEITVEANPESCDGNFVKECVNIGVNRISLGFQSHDDRILRSIGRIHTAKDFFNAVKLISNAGIKNISADVMTGLPNQSVKSVTESLDRLIAADVIKHVSVYGLTVDEGTPFYDEGFTADEDREAESYDAAVKFLHVNGFFRYEVSNFSIPGYESRHNKKYWTGGEYYGFGAGAHSFLSRKSQYQDVKAYERIENNDNVSLYNIGKVEKRREAITKEERFKEIIMLSLRTADGLDLQKLKNETGRDLFKEKEIEIEGLIRANLAELDGSVLYVNKSAFYLLNTVILKLI